MPQQHKELSIDDLKQEISRLKSLLSESSISGSMAGTGLMAMRIDKEDKITYINGEMAEYFSTETKSLVGQHMDILGKLPHQEVVDAFVTPLKELKEGEQHLDTIKDGNQNSFSLNILYNKGFRDLTLKDISDQVRLQNFVNQYVASNLDDLTPEEMSTFEFPERRNMSVSFTDLRGFTSMSEGLSPEEVREVINTYLDDIIRAVDENGNTVDKIVGDEVMALYGAPRYYQNHALRAVKTSWEQIQNLRETQNLYIAQGKRMPDCGIGINTGDMVLGNIGGGSRQDYTVLGAAVNLGARLCDHAAPRQILCSEMTLDSIIENLESGWQALESEEPVEELLKDGSIFAEKTKVTRIGPDIKNNPKNTEYRFVAMPPIMVKGIDRPITIFSVHGPRAHASGLSSQQVQREAFLKIFGEYRLIKELGKGGMGQVFLAKDSFENPVAIKLLLAGDGATESQLARFAREADIMAKLNHRNICRIVKVGEVDNTRFIAMELIDGPCLSDVITKNGLDLEELYINRRESIKSAMGTSWSSKKNYKDRELVNFTISFFLDLLAGLQYAHQHSILHRDLKPANIMCRREGEPVLMDFGLAQHDVEEDGEVSLSGQIVGTIDYMAPEQAAGDEIDVRADVYSTCAILYLLLTGKKHFQSSGNILTDLQDLREHVAPNPSKYRKGISEDLDVVIQKGLNPSAHERYSDIESLMSDLKAVMEGLPILARRDNILQKTTRWAKRHKAITGLALGSIVTISTLSLTHVQQMSSTLKAYREAELRAAEERKRALGSLSDLQKALDKAIENQNWIQSKEIALRLLVYDKENEEAKEIIARADYENLNKDFPYIEHPPSGFNQRILYLERAIQQWQNLADRGNPFAQDRLIDFQEQLELEREIVPEKQDLIDQLGMKEDQKGHFIDHPCGIRFRYIPPGRFQMGDVVSKPVHPVLITRGFFLSETEISQKQWLSLFDINPSKNQNSEYLPVTNLNWAEALMYCNALNDEYGYQTISDDEDPSRIHLSLIMSRRGFRLPTEAEWEYACRSDQPNEDFFWWQDERFNVKKSISPMWFEENTGTSFDDRAARPVGEYQPNPWGLKDMNGNVWEWVLDTYDANFYRMSDTEDPICIKVIGQGVVRGGGFRSSMFLCRNGSRVSMDSEIRNSTIGFRVLFSP
jgi:serine/threonine protein kinase/class 3 adenylate cyclase/formylglycine-generating enzyme required for sulfatase activity